MSRPFFSIIMPIYNTENYILRAINSVLIQPFSDFELLCINDKTKDNAFNIAKEISEKDKRLVCIDSNQNVGQSSTRNKGLKLAKGQYVLFLDSDDEIEKNALGILYERLKDGTFDCAMFSYKYVYPNGTEIKQRVCDPEINEFGREEFKKYILSLFPHEFISCVGSKAYSLDFIKRNNLFFDIEHKYNEDLGFSLSVFSSAKRFCYLSDSLYRYNLRNSGSTMSSYKEDNYLANLLYYRRLYLKFIDNYYSEPLNKNAQLSDFYKIIIASYYVSLKNEKDYRKKEKFKKVLDEIRHNEFFLNVYMYFKKHKKTLPLKKRCFLFCLKHNCASIIWRII